MTTFGVEIECIVPTDQLSLRGGYVSLGRVVGPQVLTAIEAQGVNVVPYAGYNHTVNYNKWKVVTDASVVAPVGFAALEIVSPPLTEQAGYEQIKKVCKALELMGGRVNRTCGLHVHIGVGNASVAALRRLAVLYADSEPVVDALLPPSRRGDNNSYCRSIKSNLKLENLARANTVAQIAESITSGMPGSFGSTTTRYVKLNFASYWKYSTVEFRQHSGTIDPIKIINWVSFCLKMVEVAIREANVPIVAALPPAARPRARQLSII